MAPRMGIRSTLLKAALAIGALSTAASSVAVIELANDSALPASADGFNLTRDTETQLEWLDVDASAGRTFDDLTGVDGSNEFLPGGDFAGFRYATQRELTGAINGPQLPSLYRSLGVSASSFSSIGGYHQARALLAVAGCFGSCAAHGYVTGTLLTNDRQAPATASMEAFIFQGNNWGRSDPNAEALIRPPNDTFAAARGNWLVRPVPGSDADADGIPDIADNCTAVPNLQQVDADGDGFGNRCDADLNNDCTVNFSDLGILRSVFFLSFPAADLNVDGTVNFSDLGILRAGFFAAPGPSFVGPCTTN